MSVHHLPAFKHTEDCDAMTLGRFVLSGATAYPPHGPMRLESIVELLPRLRRQCGCGKLRIQAIETELERYRKRASAVPNPAPSLLRQIDRLVAQRTAILEELNP